MRCEPEIVVLGKIPEFPTVASDPRLLRAIQCGEFTREAPGLDVLKAGEQELVEGRLAERIH
jgi:hypothetical protein